MPQVVRPIVGDYPQDEMQDAFIALYERRTETSMADIIRDRKKVAHDLTRIRETIQHIRTKAVSSKRRKTVGALQQNERILAGKLKNLEASEDAHTLTREMVREMYWRMWTVPRVTEVRIDLKVEHIHVITDTLYGKHPRENSWHRFNAVHGIIQLPPVNPDERRQGPVGIQWKCVTSPRGHNDHPLAPQAICGRFACLGTEATSAFTKALIAHDYAGMVSIVPRFAECFGGFGSDKWPRVHPRDVPSWYIEQFGL